jgi:WD40 repeat protein
LHRHLVLSPQRPSICVTDLLSGRALECEVGHTSTITSLRFCEASRGYQRAFTASAAGCPALFGATGSYDRTVGVWDLTHGRKIASLGDHASSVWAVDIWQGEGAGQQGHSDLASSAIWVLSGEDDGAVRLWRLDFTPAPAPWISASASASSSSSSSSSSSFSGSASSPFTFELDAAHGSWSAECIHRMLGHVDSPMCLRFDPHAPARFAYSAGYDGVIRRWCLRTGTCEREYRGHAGVVFALDVADPHLIFSVGRDQHLRCFDKQTGEMIGSVLVNDSGGQVDANGQPQPPQHDLKAVLRLADGRVATASYDGRVRLWRFGGDRRGADDEADFVVSPVAEYRPLGAEECAVM